MITLCLSQQSATWLTAKPSSYCAETRDYLRQFPGIKWDKERQHYKVPAELAAVLKQCPTARVVGQWDETYEQTFYPCPNRDLRDYQRHGASWLDTQLSQTGGALLADDMGIGKSVQALTAIDMLGLSQVLILCPAVVRSHWRAQIDKWLPDSTATFSVFGYEEFLASQKPRKPECPKSPSTWHEGFPKLSKAGKPLKSYACEACGKSFTPKPRPPKPPENPDVVIPDEVHYLSNPNSQRSEAVRNYINSRSTRPLILELSGTPMTARPNDLWHPLELLHPGRWGSKFEFEKRYCNGRFEEIPKIDKAVWVAKGTSQTQELHDRLAHVMLRRTKQQVALELPARTRVTIPVELPKEAAVSLEAAMAAIDWNSQLGKHSGVGALLSQTESYKVEAAHKLALEVIANNGKVLLLTTRKSTAEELATLLSCAVVDGDTHPDKRAEILRFSCSAASCGVATILSVTTGIDLTCYDSIIMCGLDWLPSNLRQAEDRIHRIGQVNPVTIYYLIGTGTLDEIVRERVIKRLENNEAILGSSDRDFIDDLSGGSEDELLASIAESLLKRAS